MSSVLQEGADGVTTERMGVKYCLETRKMI